MQEVPQITNLVDEVNKLVRSGKSISAKDLLLEAIETHPSSPLLWEALGRTLLTLGDQPLALEALKTAHSLRQREAHPHVEAPISSDDLDLQYLNEVDGQFRTVDHYEYGEDDSTDHSAASPRPQAVRRTRLSLKKRNSSAQQPTHPSQEKISYRVVNGRIVSEPPKQAERSQEDTVSNNDTQEAPFPTLPPAPEPYPVAESLSPKSLAASSGSLDKPAPETGHPVNSKPDVIRAQDTLLPIAVPITLLSPKPAQPHVEATNDSQRPAGTEVPSSTSQDNYDLENEQDDYLDVGSLVDEAELSDEVLGSNEPHEVLFFDNFDLDTDDKPDIYTDFLDADEAELYSFDPDEVDDEDDLDHSAEMLTQLTPEDRAYQVAIEFAHRFDWSIGHLDLLATIFNSRGWGAVKKVLTHYAELGMTANELAVATQLRSSWAQSKHYWIVFYPNGQSDSRYKHLSWAQCLRLVRLFSEDNQSVPDCVEILALIEALYQEWFSSNALRRYYRAFAKYLSGWIYQHANSNLPLHALNSFGTFDTFEDELCSDGIHYDLMGIGLNEELESYGFSYGKGGLLRQAYQKDYVGEGSFFDKSLFEEKKPKEVKEEG